MNTRLGSWFKESTQLQIKIGVFLPAPYNFLAGPLNFLKISKLSFTILGDYRINGDVS